MTVDLDAVVRWIRSESQRYEKIGMRNEAAVASALAKQLMAGTWRRG